MTVAPSVAVLVPHGESVRAEFALSLRGLHLPEGSVLISSGARPLDFARNDLARRALETGASWFLWLDSDMVFPPDTLRRLLAHRRMFVSGLYATREEARSKSCAYMRAVELPGKLYRAIVPPKDPALIEVDGVGFGCVLTHREIFERTPEPWFSFPYSGREILGEDFFFCQRVAEAMGVRPFVDTGLRLGHAWSRVVMPPTEEEELARGGVLGVSSPGA